MNYDPIATILISLFWDWEFDSWPKTIKLLLSNKIKNGSNEITERNIIEFEILDWLQE